MKKKNWGLYTLYTAVNSVFFFAGGYSFAGLNPYTSACPVVDYWLFSIDLKIFRDKGLRSTSKLVNWIIDDIVSKMLV